jgi:hypothetical protein
MDREALMTENAPIVERVTAILTANGYADARDTSAPAGQRKFVVNGGVHAMVTMSWGPEGEEDHQWLDGCRDVLLASGFDVEDCRSYFNVRDFAG